MNEPKQKSAIDFNGLINTYREPAWIIDKQGSVLALNALARRYYQAGETLGTLPALQKLPPHTSLQSLKVKNRCHRISENPDYYVVFSKQSPPQINVFDTREDLLQQFIQFIPNPVFIKDRQHRWISFNQSFADFLGCAPEALMGKTDYDFFNSAEADVFWEKDEEVFLTGQLNENEESFTDTHGNAHWILTRKIALVNQQEELILLGVITDITQQRLLAKNLDKARLQAELANQVKSKFLAQMSHELRTPLNAIIGFSQVIKSKSAHLSSTEQHYLQRIHANGIYLMTLINDLLDLSMIEAERVDIHKENCDVSRLLTDLALIFTLRAEEKGLQFTFKTLPLHLETDPTRLRQIVSNLLQNAVKFTSEGYVRLSLEPQNEGFQIVVEDSGPGVPAPLRQTIFEEFVQAKTVGGEPQQGVGLGLAISKKLCEMLGFTLSLAETPTGSRFVIALQNAEATPS